MITATLIVYNYDEYYDNSKSNIINRKINKESDDIEVLKESYCM